MELNPFKHFSLNLNGKYVGKQYFDNTMSTDRQIRQYFVGNLAAVYDLKMKKAGELTLRFLVNNLFNARYVNNAYGGMWTEDRVEKTWAYYFPQAGINYTAGISFSF